MGVGSSIRAEAEAGWRETSTISSRSGRGVAVTCGEEDFHNYHDDDDYDDDYDDNDDYDDDYYDYDDYDD